MTDAIPIALVFAALLGLLVYYWLDSRDPAFLFAGLAILAVGIAFVLFWTPAPVISAEPPRGAPVSAPVFADSASPVLHSVPGPDVSSGLPR